MKILYTSVYRSHSGYGQAALETIRAIKTIKGCELACRPIYLNNYLENNTPNDILENEQNDINNIDVVIQHCLPHTFQYKHGIKNIGFFDWETTNFNKSNWTQCLNMMDEIWVPCIQNRYACIHSGVTKPIFVIPHPFNKKRLTSNNECKKIYIENENKTTIFYTIGEMSKRKNIEGLIRAYYYAFTKRDNVILFLKTNIPGQSKEESKQNIINDINNIKKSLHMYMDKDYYPKIMICTERLSEEEISNIHRQCDVFVSPSRGEAHGLGSQEALAFGNSIIVSGWGGQFDICVGSPSQYWNQYNNMFDLNKISDINIRNLLIDGRLSPCYGMTSSFMDLYTGSELWFDADIVELSKKMKFYHDKINDNKLYNKEFNKNIGLRFTHETVGNMIKDLFNV